MATALAYPATMRNLILTVCLLLPTIALAQDFDLVLEGGRVIDPETNLDARRNVGVRDGKIVRISAEPLSGKRVIDAV